MLGVGWDLDHLQGVNTGSSAWSPVSADTPVVEVQVQGGDAGWRCSIHQFPDRARRQLDEANLEELAPPPLACCRHITLPGCPNA